MHMCSLSGDRSPESLSSFLALMSASRQNTNTARIPRQDVLALSSPHSILYGGMCICTVELNTKRPKAKNRQQFEQPTRANTFRWFTLIKLMERNACALADSTAISIPLP